MIKRLISLLLALILISSFIACADTSDKEPSNNGDATDVESTVAEETETTALSRENTPDNLPALDFQGATVNIYHFGLEDAVKYDAVGEQSGDVVYDAVYRRNLNVEERLKVKINWIAGSEDWDGHPNNVKTYILSGLNDYDIIFEENSRCFQHSLYGYWKDLIDAPYLDYDQPWWYDSFMSKGSIDNSHRYFVTGDFALTTLFGASASYFNKPLFTQYFGDVNELYNAVLDGKWTHELAMKYCRDVYTDVNGNNEADKDDIFGFRYQEWGVINYLSMSTGLEYSTRDSEGLPVLNIYNEDSIKWGETLYKMLYTDNMSIETDTTSLQKAFRDSKSLFHFGLLGDANIFRDTSFEFGILPHPKLYESLNYVSAAGTVNGEGAAIPTSTPDDKLELCCAVLEALCAESYRIVVPAYYDTALKVKYVEQPIDAQMIDIIYNTIDSSFIMIADKELGTGSIFKNAVYKSGNEGAFASFWSKQEKSITKKWDKMIEQYKSLSE